jgi:hypothetical protein
VRIFEMGGEREREKEQRSSLKIQVGFQIYFGILIVKLLCSDIEKE